MQTAPSAKVLIPAISVLMPVYNAEKYIGIAIESHLPEQSVYGISDHPREPGPKGIVVEMGDSEILLHMVAFRPQGEILKSFDH